MIIDVTFRVRAHSKNEAANDFVGKVDAFKSWMADFQTHAQKTFGASNNEVRVRPLEINLVRFD